MGLFQTLFTSLGLEEDRQQSPIKPRRRETFNKIENNYQNFNLHERKEKEETINKNTFHPQNTNLAIFAPSTLEEVQKIIFSLKLQESCIVNLENIKSSDRTRILDFFSGAVFALSGEIARIQGDLFLVTPKSVNIKVN